MLHNNYFSCAVDQTVVVLLQPIRARQIRLQLISTNHRHQAAFCLDQIHFQTIHLLILEFLPLTIHNLTQCLLTSLIHLHILTANKVNSQTKLNPSEPYPSFINPKPILRLINFNLSLRNCNGKLK